jgi:hypothetical protein
MSYEVLFNRKPEYDGFIARPLIIPVKAPKIRFRFFSSHHESVSLVSCPGV